MAQFSAVEDQSAELDRAGGSDTGVYEEWQFHRPLFAIIAVYAIAACALTRALGFTKYHAAWQLVGLWMPLIVSIPLLMLAYALARGLAKSPSRPLPAALAVIRGWRPSELLVGFALALSIGVFYASFVMVKNVLPRIVPFYADPFLADLDASLHGGQDPWRLLEPLFSHQPGPMLIELTYGFIWATLLIYVPAMVAVHPALRAIRRRFFVTFFACWILVGNVLALLGMSGGPVYYGRLVGDPARFADLLRFTAEHQLFTGWVQQYLWDNYSTGSVELATGISAFPSLHVGIATLYFVAARRFGRIAWALSALFLLLIQIGSVLLGWHYAIDGYASMLVVAVIWTLAGRWAERTAPALKPA